MVIPQSSWSVKRAPCLTPPFSAPHVPPTLGSAKKDHSKTSLSEALMAWGCNSYVPHARRVLWERDAPAMPSAKGPRPPTLLLPGSQHPCIPRRGCGDGSVIKNAIKRCHLAEKSYSLGIII